VTRDPTVSQIREEISELDRAIVGAVNERIELVAHLKRYKEENGLPFLDPERERELLAELVRLNTGPLTEDGLRELMSTVLELTKRELERTNRG
jgi:chorismate mutase/prephenate dehydratase